MRNQIKTIFGVSDDVFEETTATENFVFDPPSEDNTSSDKCHLVHDPKSTDEWHFKFSNPKSQNISLLPIDNCLNMLEGTQRCDFALFSPTVFCFGDIKNVKTKQRGTAKSEAANQILSTLNSFIAKGINFTDFSLKAIIALKFEKIYPAASTSKQEAKLIFAEKNCDLLEGNEYIFED